MPSQGRVYVLAGKEKHLRGERPKCPLAQAQPSVPPPLLHCVMSNHFEAYSGPGQKKKYGVRDSNPPLLLFPWKAAVIPLN